MVWVNVFCFMVQGAFKNQIKGLDVPSLPVNILSQTFYTKYPIPLHTYANFISE